MNRYCTWPRGCEQLVSLADGHDQEVCFYHFKLGRGFFNVPARGLRHATFPGDVLTDEQLELTRFIYAGGWEAEALRMGRMLAQLGADRGKVAQVIAMVKARGAAWRPWRG